MEEKINLVGLIAQGVVYLFILILFIVVINGYYCDWKEKQEDR